MKLEKEKWLDIYLDIYQIKEKKEFEKCKSSCK